MARVLLFIQLVVALVVVPLLPGLDSRYLVWGGIFLGLVWLLPVGAVLAVYGWRDAFQAALDAWSVETPHPSVARSLLVWDLASRSFPTAGVLSGMMALIGPLTQWTEGTNPVAQALMVVLFCVIWGFLGLVMSRILGEVVRGLAQRAQRTQRAPSSAVVLTEGIAARFGLTQRETEAARWLLDGMTYRDAANQLQVAPSTVKSHVLSVYQKTGTGNKVELLRLVEAETHRLHQSANGTNTVPMAD